jgi:hypothetical protein
LDDADGGSGMHTSSPISSVVPTPSLLRRKIGESGCKDVDRRSLRRFLGPGFHHPAELDAGKIALNKMLHGSSMKRKLDVPVTGRRHIQELCLRIERCIQGSGMALLGSHQRLLTLSDGRREAAAASCRNSDRIRVSRSVS